VNALPVADDRAIWDIWLSQLHLPAMAVAVELSIFDTLAAGPLTVERLCERLHLQPQRCEILLRMLDSLGLLIKHQETYQLSRVARDYLLKDGPFFWGHVWAAQATPVQIRLREALKFEPGEPGGRPVEGWESGQMTDEMATTVTRMMNSHSLGAAHGLARSGATEGDRRLLDVGGGSGCFSIALAQQHRSLRCTIMDLAPVCRLANEYIRAAQLSDRVGTLPVDMFREAWPQGYDAVFFSNIFHDWSPKVCADLAAKSYRILPEGGHIRLHEMLLDGTGAHPRTTAAFSVLMLAGTKGQQFTFAELAQILTGAGFVDVAATPTYGYYSLVSARKPSRS
jgi:predicted O-methyltransferase YrrM